MSTNTKNGPIFEAGQCRCCGATKKCRLLNVEYKWFGQKEIYSDMFMDTFGLLLSQLDGEAEERLVCATCVSRLREASCFRHQVLQCEEKLLRTKIHGEHAYLENGADVTDEVKLEAGIKKEVEITLDEINVDINMDDLADHIDNDTEDLPIEAAPMKTRLKRQKLNSRLVHKKKRKKIDKRKVAKEMLNEEIITDNFRKYNEVDTPQKNNEIKMNQTKAMNNIYTLIENSYVCPFETSYSDYYCVYCREAFTDPNKLRDHTLIHDPTTFKTIFTNNKKAQIDIYRIDCRLCSEIINSLDTFKNHLQNVHQKQLHSVEDDFLKFKLTTSNLICMECGATFGFFHALKKHMAEHFGTCICDICGAHYFEERMLILHQKTHQNIEESYSCKDCGKIFKSKYTRYIHIAKTHTKEPAYHCNKCDEVFFTYTLRYRHKMDIHGEERSFQCEHCDRAYDNRKSLREHNRRCHLKILKHQCDLCDKRFYLPSRLKEHMASHTGERNFRCEYCGKSYPRIRGLKVHMQSHSMEKKYKCNMCNASFTQNVNLKNHLKRQHQNLDIDGNYPE